LAADGNAIIEGNLETTSPSEEFSNMVVIGYVDGGGQKSAPDATRVWTAETVPNDSRYIQFQMSPKSGYNFDLSSINFLIGWAGSSYIFADVYYSTDSTFNTKTLIGEKLSAASTSGVAGGSSSLNVQVMDGETLYVRFYPYASRDVTGKNFGIANLVIKGSAYSSDQPAVILGNPVLFDKVRVGETKDLSFTLSGSMLNPESGNIEVTAPDGFQVSVTSEGVFSSTLSIPYSGSTMELSNVYLRFSPTEIKSYSGFLEVSGGGTETQTLSVTGVGVNANTVLKPISFPGAEGYGKYTVGGRGGSVIEVTNLNDSGTGSLRAAVQASGPRTVVFTVSGTITLNSELTISNPYITIAGQTAPGDGICLRKYPLVIEANQVIIRYIRVRLGDESGLEADAVSSRYTKNVILDHVSASWSVDETMSVYHCDSVTIQWCLISESMYNSNHEKGAHGFGGIWGSNYSTSHHNLLAHHSSRNPRMASGCGNFDYRNNVVYNWGYNSTYGGEQQEVDDPDHAFTNINMVANYYKPGPATTPGVLTYRIANPSYRTVKTDYGKWYIDDNVMADNSTVTINNWNGGVQPQGDSEDYPYLKLDSSWSSMAIDQQIAEDAYSSVLDNVGAALPKRDVVDTRVVNDTRNGNATYEGETYEINKTVPDINEVCGIIDSQEDVGGWPLLTSQSAPTDTDYDGMPDEWESANGLNPEDASDRNITGIDGYTNLEKYLNSIEFSYPVDGYELTKLSDGSFELKWSDSYLAEDSFKVERSLDNGEFTEIAQLPKYSNSYIDNSGVSASVITYRVVAYNSDNSTPATKSISSYATALDDPIANEEKEIISCSPNPFSDVINIYFYSADNQIAQIDVYDLCGRKVLTLNDQQVHTGNNKIECNEMAGLKPGAYTCSVILGKYQSKNMVIIKK
jgi:pectate lyase